MSEVLSDGALAIIAGADTVGSALSNVFWLLLCNPSAYSRLQAEVDRIFPDGENALDPAKHVHMQYLNAVM
jgi:cytochrome P450